MHFSRFFNVMCLAGLTMLFAGCSETDTSINSDTEAETEANAETVVAAVNEHCPIMGRGR